jgi:hypothetical protein
MVAPSVVDGKAYKWANDREMKPCPVELDNTEKMADDRGEIPGYIFEGERNNQLTRIAGIYAGRGLDYDQVFEGVWGANLNRCSKPLDKSEVHRIVASIMNSEESKEDNLKARIEEFIEDEPGFFTIAQLDAELGIKQDEKNYRKQILHRLCNEGKLERGNQRGLYRIKNKNKKGMNFMRIKKAEISLPLPLDLSNYTRVAPKNIIIIAGATNAGKTTFVMNIIHSILNCNAVKITDLTGQSATRNAKISENYIISDSMGGKPLSVLLGEQITGTSSAVDLLFMNSEMSEIELSQRFSEFPGGVESFDHPNFEVVERESNFEDIVNPDGVNIIDYLPVHDKFWLVADKIKKIHDRLNKGIAVICIQKRSDKPFARGGEFTLELCRLGIALDNNSPYGHICTILKNKIPLDPRNKLGGESRDFKIGGGACIRAISEWRYIKDKKERERVNSFYAVEPENEAEFEPDEFMGEAV